MVWRLLSNTSVFLGAAHVVAIVHSHVSDVLRLTPFCFTAVVVHTQSFLRLSRGVYCGVDAKHFAEKSEVVLNATSLSNLSALRVQLAVCFIPSTRGKPFFLPRHCYRKLLQAHAKVPTFTAAALQRPLP